ncbi:hypothetical protein MTO96_034889 [Rhipicephalus appendiculatus]
MTHATLAAMLLLLAATWQCDGAQRVHERLSDSEIRRVFRVASREEVPQYELVQLRARRHQRSEREVGGGGDRKAVSLRAFGRRFDLRLKRNRDFEQRAARLQVLAAESTPNGLAYTPLRSKDEEVPDDLWSRAGAYQDHTNMAALVLSQDKLGSPSHGVTPTTRDSWTKDDASPRHVVFKRPGSSESSSTFGTGGDAKGDPLSDYAHLDDAFFRYRIVRNRTSTTAPPPLQKLGHKSRRRRASDPDTVWPEILLIVDYDTYLLHGRSHTDIKRYLVSFWNGVDLAVSAALQSSGQNQPGGNDRGQGPRRDALPGAESASGAQRGRHRRSRSADRHGEIPVPRGPTAHVRPGGFAYVGGACVVNKRLEKVNSVAIIEDSGGFSGIIVAAHEVGHLLGCVHDGSPAPGYLGGPGAQRCPWEDGFIMSDLRHTERGFRWSSCSVQQFRHFLLGETASCLYNYPHENQLLARMLPGSMLSLDDQCRRDRGTTACFKDSRVCAQLFCYDSSSGYCVSYRPAAEGSPCGDGQTCKNGRCIAEIENIIPDYTHVTPSFASGRSVGGRGGGADVARRRADFSAEVVDGPRPHLMPAPPASPAPVAPPDREPSPAPAAPQARPPHAHHEKTTRARGQRQRLRRRQHRADRRPHDVRPVPGAIRQPLLQPRLHPEALLLLAEPVLLLNRQPVM